MLLNGCIYPLVNKTHGTSLICDQFLTAAGNCAVPASVAPLEAAVEVTLRMPAPDECLSTEATELMPDSCWCASMIAMSEPPPIMPKRSLDNAQGCWPVCVPNTHSSSRRSSRPLQTLMPNSAGHFCEARSRA